MSRPKYRREALGPPSPCLEDAQPSGVGPRPRELIPGSLPLRPPREPSSHTILCPSGTRALEEIMQTLGLEGAPLESVATLDHPAMAQRGHWSGLCSTPERGSPGEQVPEDGLGHEHRHPVSLETPGPAGLVWALLLLRLCLPRVLRPLVAAAKGRRVWGPPTAFTRPAAALRGRAVQGPREGSGQTRAGVSGRLREALGSHLYPLCAQLSRHTAAAHTCEKSLVGAGLSGRAARSRRTPQPAGAVT